MSRPGRHAAALLVAVLPFWAHALAAHAADREAGRRKAEACVACHGPGGISQNPVMPSIAAQPRQFLVTQLVMFRDGNRKDPLMSPVAVPLTNADVHDLAEYFSTQALSSSSRGTDPKLAAAGKRLTEQYYCVECHSPTLEGQQHVPRLAGQQRQYLLTQLKGFKAGTRFDMDGNMSAAVQNLSDADAEILADYLSTLR
jgi:cytochrome c553